MDKTVQKNINRIVFNPPRPQIDDEIKYIAALKLAKDNPELNEELPPEEIATIIVEIAADCCSIDGYYLAKELDDVYFWDIWTEKVIILNNYERLLKAELRQVQEKWVKTNNIQPQFSVGTTVKFKKGENEYVGVIEKISKVHPACYEIKTNLDTNDFTIKEFEECWLAEESESA